MRNWLKRICAMMYAPIKNNSWFFFWMYILGMACVLLVLRTGKHRTPVDLFLDLYLLCALLMIFPKRIRKWVRGVLYVVFYGLALIDVFCYSRLGGPIGPSLLQNVLQTNPREASEARKKTTSARQSAVASSPSGTFARRRARVASSRWSQRSV